VARARIKAAVARSALMATLVLGTGYLSNLVTRPWCERDLMRAAVHDMSGGRPMPVPVPVYVLPETATRSEVALRRLGVSTVRCTRAQGDPGSFDCFPWAGVASRIRVPYIVVVRWEYVAFPTSGHGKVTTFFCLFGLRIPVAESGIWIA
jgi:hypothetical protein